MIYGIKNLQCQLRGIFTGVRFERGKARACNLNLFTTVNYIITDVILVLVRVNVLMSKIF